MPLPALPPPAAPSEPWSQCPNTESQPQAASASAANDNLDAGWTVESTVVSPAPDLAAERPLRVSVFRAAIPFSDQRSSSFFIQRLASGQRPPAGMVEAMIVVTGESDDNTIGFEATLGTAKGTSP
jgi:hypothetical protein